MYFQTVNQLATMLLVDFIRNPLLLYYMICVEVLYYAASDDLRIQSVMCIKSRTKSEQKLCMMRVKKTNG
jgi:hypothetical protein